MEKGEDPSPSLLPLPMWAAVSPLAGPSSSLAGVPSAGKAQRREIIRHRVSQNPSGPLSLLSFISFPNGSWKSGVLAQAVCPLPGIFEEGCGLFLSEPVLADGFSWGWVVLPLGTGMTARWQWLAVPVATGRAVRQPRNAGRRKLTSPHEPITTGGPWPTAKEIKA